MRSLQRIGPEVPTSLLRRQAYGTRGQDAYFYRLQVYARKVLSFIVTDNAGSTETGTSYLSKYPDQFTDVAIRAVVCPLVMSILFSAVNEVDSHNKSRKFDSALREVVGYSMWVGRGYVRQFSMGNNYYKFLETFSLYKG